MLTPEEQKQADELQAAKEAADKAEELARLGVEVFNDHVIIKGVRFNKITIPHAIALQRSVMSGRFDAEIDMLAMMCHVLTLTSNEAREAVRNIYTAQDALEALFAFMDKGFDLKDLTFVVNNFINPHFKETGDKNPRIGGQGSST